MYNFQWRHIYVKSPIMSGSHILNFQNPFYEFWAILRYFLRRSGQLFRPKVIRKKYHCLIFSLKGKKRLSLENGHLLLPAFWVVNIHRNQRGWYQLFIFDAPWFHLRKIHVADTTRLSSTHRDTICEKDSMNTKETALISYDGQGPTTEVLSIMKRVVSLTSENKYKA